MVMNLESFGVDGAGYDETETGLVMLCHSLLAQDWLDEDKPSRAIE
jgi:hypothetical protein